MLLRTDYNIGITNEIGLKNNPSHDLHFKAAYLKMGRLPQNILKDAHTSYTTFPTIVIKSSFRFLLFAQSTY